MAADDAEHPPSAATTKQFALLGVTSTGLPLLLAYGLVGTSGVAQLIAAGAHLIFVTVATLYLAKSGSMPQVGWCNVITMMRLGITSALIVPLLAPTPFVPLVALSLVALILDGLDGWLARRFDQATEFGARFDMEVDALFGLLLACNAWAAGTAGPLVLLLGIPRYGFLAAGNLWPWINQSLPERFGRKVVCVVQIAALIAVQIPALAGIPAFVILIVALAALSWSFGRDVLWLRRSAR